MNWRWCWGGVGASLATGLAASACGTNVCMVAGPLSAGVTVVGMLMGVYFRKNFLFLSVVRPVPSTLTKYWSCGLVSKTVPVLSHLLGLGPLWFCRKTLSPTVRGANLVVCSVQASCIATCLLAKPFSL